MGNYTYKEILAKSKEIKKNTESLYKLGASAKWSYYICKAIITPNKDIKRFNIEDASKPTGNYLSRQISKADYLDMAKRIVKFVETNHKMPNYVTYKNFMLTPALCTYVFARVLVYYDSHKAYPNNVNVNSKCFTKPVESSDEVFNYFEKKFGKITCIDDALEKVDNKGYGYYYDDQKTNKETIDAMANNNHNDDPNCTDSCHVFKNIGDKFVKKGKYKKCDVIHVKCRGGDGHVRLRFLTNSNKYFYRDPACTLSDGGMCNWCMDGTILAVNPSWFMENLHR